MVTIELIGNLGADAQVKESNGSKFVSFNVCDNRRVNGQEVSQWYGCTINRVNENLLKYLRKGQNVFVRGVPKYRVFDSALHHCKMVAVDVFVNDIQLIGSAPESSGQSEKPADAPTDNVTPF